MPHAPELYRHPKDDALATELANESDVKQALRTLETANAGYGFVSRRHLLTGALRLTRSMAPEIADTVSHCRSVLGFDAPVEVYVQQESLFNAFAMPRIGAGPYVMVLSSRLLEAFTPEELRFVVGHELGHMRLDHFRLPVPRITTLQNNEGAIVGRANALKLFLWSRAAELSADRAGLLCGGDPEAAASGFFKLASGLSSTRIKPDLEAFSTQLDSLEASPKARGSLDASQERELLDCFLSHPYNPIRVRALLAFFRSKRFHDASGHGPNTLDDAQVDALTNRDLALMEPSYLEEKGVASEQFRAALYAGGVLVATADGEVHTNERQALRSLLGQARVEEPLDAEKAKKRFDALLPSLLKEPLAQRARLVQHLVVVSASDGVVDPREVGQLEALAQALQVDPVVVHETVRSAAHPLD